MFSVILERIKQKHRTHEYPAKPVTITERYRGCPEIHQEKCLNCNIESQACRQCIDQCPTEAIQFLEGKLTIDLGRCLFCRECVESCPTKTIQFTNDYRLATSQRMHLQLSDQELQLAQSLEKKILKVFGRSLKLRQVSAAGCNACEADTNVLNTLFFDLGRFGIQFVASPRHADGILVTGPVSKNMLHALKKTYDAVPSPKFVIAVGACAISGGIYRDMQTTNGVEGLLPVDLYIPGCPPHPMTILDGLLRLLGRIDNR